MSLFKGSGVALITPFNRENRVNFEKLRELLEFHVENKTDAIIINGTTGESATLSKQEKLEVIRFTVEVINGRIPVIAGTGSNNSAEALEMSMAAEELGVDGLLIVTPYYNKGNENGLYIHFKTIADLVGLPIILYNVPLRTGVNLSIDLLKKLAEVRNIVGIKEASGDIAYVAKIAREVPQLAIYSGNDDITVPILSLGGYGVISVAANIFPEEIHNMTEAFFTKDNDLATEMQLEYNKVIDALFLEVNPVPIKEAMNYIGYEVGGCRLPLGAMNKENKEKLHKILDEFFEEDEENGEEFDYYENGDI